MSTWWKCVSPQSTGKLFVPALTMWPEMMDPAWSLPGTIKGPVTKSVSWAQAASWKGVLHSHRSPSSVGWVQLFYVWLLAYLWILAWYHQESVRSNFAFSGSEQLQQVWYLWETVPFMVQFDLVIFSVCRKLFGLL